MDANDDKLAAIRRRIDAIDDKLLDLLMDRARAMAEVQAAKGGAAGVLARPGREIAILRRLIARREGALPADLVVRIWRDTMTSFTRLQGPFAIGTLDKPALIDLARRHYGLAVPLVEVGTPGTLFAKLVDGAVQLALFPSPEDSAQAWWTRLTPGDAQVLARLPVDGTEMQPGAMVVGRQAFEPSGEDRSLVILESAEAQSRPKIAKRFATARLEFMRVLAETEDGQGVHTLCLCGGALAPGDPRLAELAGRDGRARLAGGYALPLALAPGATQHQASGSRSKGTRK
ncbi:MAG: chorismate mutase [Tagaea sp.]|nr:chorismate mutase [Tagaea sp.]